MVKRLTIILISLGLFFAALSFMFHTHHPHFFWEHLSIFDTLFGIVGCIVLIIVAESLGHFWLQKDEDYYDK